MDSLYLINKLSSKKIDLLIFKNFLNYNGKTTIKYLFLEIDTTGDSYKIISQILTNSPSNMIKFYKINLQKTSLGDECLFSGTDIFHQSKTTQCENLYTF